ncbi:MAG TPA: protein kinase [Ktedonobacterales bacterium]
MATCPYCRTANRADAVYCNMCGGQLKGASSAHPLVAPTNATGRLTPSSQLHLHYEILATVGQGGMAAVYKAREMTTGATVAIKEMSQDGLPPDELKDALASFTFEADTLRRLRHPNLPRVYERFAEHFRQYLVMDFVDGQTLEQRLQAAGGQPLAQADVLGWARQICDVLTYLHSQKPPIIFRDLKPANIMLTRDGHIYLIDFGIARVFAPGRSRDTQVLGTPGFAPPEQYGKAQTDPRADVYALGCTLYQLLTAYDPATTPFNLPPMRSRVPTISPGVQRAIERATKLNRDERYPTVAAFAADLVAGAPAAAAAPSRAKATAPGPAAGASPRAAPPPPPPPSSPPSSAAKKPGQGGQAAAVFAATAAAAAAAIKTTSPAAAAALQAAARMAAPPPMAAIVVVQPPQVDFGKIAAGQRAARAITISGQGGMHVRGRITPLAPWLKVDTSTFDGKTSVVQVIAQPGASLSGVQQGMLQMSCDGQQLFVPVTATVQPAKGKPKPSVGASGGRPAAGAKRSAAPGARSTATAKHTAAPVTSGRRGVGFVTSATLGIGAAGATFALAPRALVYTQLHGVAALPVLAALGLFGVAALLAGLVAVLGSGARPTLGRIATGLLGAVIAALALLVAGNPWVWPPLNAWLSAPVALAPPLLVIAAICAGLGAAIGGDPLLSQWIHTVARFAVRYSRLLSAIALVLGGAYLGWVLTSGLGGILTACLMPLAVIGGAGAGFAISRLLRPALPRASYRRYRPVRQWP